MNLLSITKAPKSRAEIERLVLAELRDCGGCEAAAGISVVGYDSDTGNDDALGHEPNWTVGAFNAGAASDYECERALIGIVSRLQRFYQLVRKH